MAVIELGGGARVKGDARAPLVLRNPAGIEEVEVFIIDSHPELDRHRDLAGRLDRSPDDRLQQPRFRRNGGAAAFTGHLADRTPEVEIEVVDAAFIHETAYRLADIERIDAVKLEAARALGGAEVGQLEGLLAALNQRPGGDHFADVEPSPEAAAQRAKWIVRDPCHRREDHRW